MGYWKAGDELNQGKFVVEELLGSGGFGVTYKIRQAKTNKLFALKTLNELARSKPDFQQLQAKFINEAIALANCRHPNIVRVYPQGFQEGELWCMVMQYIKGQDLARELDLNGKFPEAKAVEIVTKVGEALGFVHQQGLLHRDIKPANILLRKSDSTPVLIDFGLAREYNANPDSIGSMTNSMTECYAPIEQYQRQGKFGAWTDVYALAATLYVLVTKQPPFPARFREHAELIPPQKHNPQISDRINDGIVKGLGLQPENRPQTVKAWLRMLKPPEPKPQPPVQPEYIEPSSISVPPKHKPKPEPKPVSRRNWLKYSGLAIASMLVALVGREIIDQPEKIEFTETKVSDAEYEFDVITVNDRGEEINGEKESAKYFTEDLGNAIALDMVKIPAGTFLMGTEDTSQRDEDEKPQHQVTIPSFYMGKYEVTQRQWKAVAAMPQIDRELKPDPSRFKGEDLPVESVSWFDAVEFCARLSKATGREYRLPSEAEWEYACRGGTTTPFHYGETITSELVNYRGTSTYANEPKGEYRDKTTPVGSFPPNAFGLYDMHGNVYEWCADTYQESYEGAPSDGSAWVTEDNSNYVLRGGSWFDTPHYCRSALRLRNAPVNDYDYLGFRCIATRTL